MDDRTRAFEFSHKDILLRKEDISGKDEEASDLKYGKLKGYTISDESNGEIGIIEEIIEMPQQEMAVLKLNKKEVLIPLNENLILEIDESKKIVTMDLPAGLVEL